MTIIWLILFIVGLAVLVGAASSKKPGRLEPHETIHDIGAQARREAHDISEEFLRKAITLLGHERR
jgi:hypothetical protein